MEIILLASNIKWVKLAKMYAWQTVCLGSANVNFIPDIPDTAN